MLSVSNSAFTPECILMAITSIENELPDLVGKDWPNIETKYRGLCTRLKSTTGLEQMRTAAELQRLLAEYDNARKYLRNAIMSQTIAGEIFFNMAELTEQLGFDASVISLLREAAIQPISSERIIFMDGPTRAVSVKLGNIRFNFDALINFIFGVIATISKNVLGQPNLLFKAAGVLTIIHSFYKVINIELSERDVTVFLGLINATGGPGNGVKEEVILDYTNIVRNSISLKPLDSLELGNALYNLSEIKSIERVAGINDMWRVIETYHMDRLKEGEYL